MCDTEAYKEFNGALCAHFAANQVIDFAKTFFGAEHPQLMVQQGDALEVFQRDSETKMEGRARYLVHRAVFAKCDLWTLTGTWLFRCA